MDDKLKSQLEMLDAQNFELDKEKTKLPQLDEKPQTPEEMLAELNMIHSVAS